MKILNRRQLWQLRHLDPLNFKLGALRIGKPLVAGFAFLGDLNQAVDQETQERLARDVVQAVHDRVDALPPEVAQRVIEALQREYTGASPQ